MEKNISDTKVNNVKNVARLSIAKSDVKSIKVVDADIVIYLKTGKRIVVRDGVVKAMMDPDFSIGFVDGEISAQAALQQSGLVDLNPISTATVASTSDAVKTDDSTTSTTVSKSVMSSEMPSYADTAAPVAMQAPAPVPDVVAQAKPAPEPTLFDTVRPYIGAVGLLGLASGGGGASAASDGLSSITADTVVSGSLVLGPVTSSNGLTVNLYKADGTWLGSSVVASGGAFSVKLSDKSYTGPIIAVVSDSTNGVGGEDFVDEATGEAKDLGAKYMAIQTVSAGVATSLNINALTTVAAIHAGVPKEWDEGKTTLTKVITATDVTTNNAAVGSMFGISNIVTDTVSPIINSSGSYVSSGNYYGQVLAAVSGIDEDTGDQKATIDLLVAHSAGGTMTSDGVEAVVKGATIASTEASSVAQKVDTAAANTAASYDSAATLTAIEVNDLSLSTVASLSATAVQKIGADIVDLSPDAFKAINFSYFSDTQVAALSSAQVGSLNKVQLAQMTSNQLAALGDNITYLPLTTLANLSQSSSENLTSAQLLALAEKGMLDNLSTQLTTTQVDGLAGSLAGSISAADTKIFNSILANITDGGGATDLHISEQRIDTPSDIVDALAVVHQLTLIAALDPSSTGYADDLTKLSDEVTGAMLQLIGLAGTSGAYTESQKNALLTKLAEGAVADITGIAYLQSLVDVVKPTLSASTLPTTSKTTNYHLAGDGIGEAISLTITFSEKVKGLTSGTNNKIFKLLVNNVGVGVDATWSGTDNTSTRTLTYTIAANQNGKVTIDEIELKSALLENITDTAGNTFIHDSVIAEIDSSTFAQVDGVAPTLTLTALSDTDLSLAQATAFEQAYTAVDNEGGLNIRSTVAVVKNSSGTVQSGVTLTTTGGKVAGDLSSLVSGTYTLEVTTTDVAGNTDVESQTFVIDKEAPTLSLGVLSDTQTKLTSAEAAAYTQTYTSADNTGGTGLASTVAVVKSGSTIVKTLNVANDMTDGGHISGDLSSLADGTYTIEVTSTDVAGNTYVQTQTVVIDTTKPTITLAQLTGVLSSDGEFTSAEATNYSQEFTASDNTGGTGLASTVAVVKSGSTIVKTLNVANDMVNGGHISGDLHDLADGTYTVLVTTTDNAGNTESGSQTLVIDKVAPTLAPTALADSLLTSAEAAVYTQNYTTSDVTSGVASTVAVVKKKSSDVHQSSVSLSTAANKIAGNISSLDDGDYYIEVTTTDKAGNVTVDKVQDFSIDKTAPTTTPLTVSSIAKFAPLNLGFSEAVQKGTGTINIYTQGGVLVESFDVATSPRVTLSTDGKTATIDPTNDLSVDIRDYYATVSAGAFADPSGNPIAAIEANSWKFNAVNVGTTVEIGGVGVTAGDGINAAELQSMTLSGVITNAVDATGVSLTSVVFRPSDNTGDITVPAENLPILEGTDTVHHQNSTWLLTNDSSWVSQLVSGKTYAVLVTVGATLNGVASGSTATSASFVFDKVAPVITTSSLDANENGTSVGTVVASDSNTVTWGFDDTGADNAKFAIDATTGVLTLRIAKDYETPGSAAGSNTYDVKVKATDLVGNTTIKAITIHVVNVNEAPVNSVPAAQTTNEDTAKVITGLSIADVDAGTGTMTTTLSVTNGTLTVTGDASKISGNGTASVMLTGTMAEINAILAAANAVTFNPTPNFNGSATLTMTTSDGGNTGTGGALTDADTVAITITAVNDAPVATTSGTIATVNEDASNASAVNLWATTPVYGVGGGSDESSTQTLTYKITAIPAFIQLFKADGTTAVAANAELSATDFATLKYKTVADANGTGNVTFDVMDGASGTAPNVNTLSQSVAMTVLAVNDAPVSTTSGTIAVVNEDASNATAVNLWATTPVYGVGGGSDESSTQTLTYKITAIPAFIQLFKADGTTAVAANAVLSATEFATLKYKTVADANGTGNVTFDVMDGASGTAPNVNTLSQSVAMTVTAVNDAPVNTVPAAQTTNEDTAKVITGLSIADVDAGTGTMTTTLAVANGTLTVTGDASKISGNGTASVKLTGTMAEINAILAAANAVTFNPTPNFSGNTTLTMTTSDGGNKGTGGALTDADTVAITISPLNDKPEIKSVTNLTYVENSASTTIAAGLLLTDVDDANITGATVTISTNLTEGDLLSFADIGAIKFGGYSSVTGKLTLTGTATVAQYQAALRTVKYSSTNEDPTLTSASRTITWTVTDANSDNVGAQTSTDVTSTINVTALNDMPLVTVSSSPLEYSENASATVIDNTITLSDLDDTQITSAVVTISLDKAEGDVLSFDTAIATANGITGTYSNGTLTFSELVSGQRATVEQYQAVLQTVMYHSTSETPDNDSTTRTITWAVTDANSDGVGAQANLAKTSIINIAAIYDNPTLTTAQASTDDYANTANDRLLFVGTAISAIESQQKIKSLVLTVSGVSGTSNDRIKFDGQYIALTDGNSSTTTAHSLGYSVAVSGGQATITLTSSLGINSGDLQSLVDAMAYNYSVSAGVSSSGMEGNRVVTLSQITDNKNETTNLAHATTVKDATPPPSITNLALLTEDGPTDFVTKTASQTITATLSRALADTERLKGTLDGGANWLDITHLVSGTSLSWTGATLSAGTSTLQLKTEDAANNTSLSTAQSYTVLQNVAITGASETDTDTANFNSLAAKYRYVYIRTDENQSDRAAFGELEVWSGGNNVALGILPTTSFALYAGAELNLTNGILDVWGYVPSNSVVTNRIGYIRLDLGSDYAIDSVKLFGQDTSTPRSSGATVWVSQLDIPTPTSTNVLIAGKAIQIGGVTGAMNATTFMTSYISTDDMTPSIQGTLDAPLPANYKVAIYNNGVYVADADVDNSGNTATWNYTFANGKTAVYGVNKIEAKVLDSAGGVYATSDAEYFEMNNNVVTIAASETGTNDVDTLATKYQFVYVRVDVANSQNRVEFTELEVLVDGVNVALNGLVTTSLTLSTGGTTQSLTDGVRNAWGFSTPPGQSTGWIKVDLGTAYAGIDAVALFGAAEYPLRAVGATLWLSEFDITPTSSTVLQQNGAIQISGTSPAINGTTAHSGYIVTNDATPIIYGTLATALGSDYRLDIYYNGAKLGEAELNGREWSFDVTGALTGGGFTTGTLHQFTAKIVRVSDSKVVLTSSNADFKVSPVVLDLNHDGQINYASTLMDVTGAGVISKITWAAPDDGVLVWNKYGDGLVHDKSQYAFGDPSKGVSDLQGLAQNFDTNHDGVFNASDDKFAQFMVWQDQNGDGLSQADEVKSLTDWGVTSLNLTSDGVKNTPVTGVDEAGRTTATQSDGQSMLVADATFSYTKALVLQGVDASKDTFTISDTLTQINAFSGSDGDVIDVSGLLSQLHTAGGSVADYVQTVQRGNHTVIQVDSTGHHDFVNASNQVVLMNTTTTLALLQQQNHVVI